MKVRRCTPIYQSLKMDFGPRTCNIGKWAAPLQRFERLRLKERAGKSIGTWRTFAGK